MRKKVQKKLLKAVKKQDYEAIERYCKRCYCCSSMTEELLLRALFRQFS